MNQYKPEYLGKVIPVNDPSKLANFVVNQYDAFSKIYAICKESSNNITDIKPIESSNDSLSVKVFTDNKTLDNITKNANSKNSVNIINDVIMAK